MSPSAQPAVSVSLASVDPPLVEEYAEWTPDSTGPVITAQSERQLVSELASERERSASAALAAGPRVNRLA